MLTASILIPVRNAMPHLPEAIASAKRQGVDAEIIVFDDGSTDGSAQAAIDAGGVLVYGIGENQRLVPNAGPVGPNHARALLYTLAMGEWVQFLDADDWLPPDKVAIQMAAAGDADASYCDFVMVERAQSTAVSLANVDFWDMVCDGGRGPQTASWLLNRPRLQQRGWHPDSYYWAATDGKLLLDLLVAGADLRYCPDTRTYYRRFWSPRQLSTQKTTRAWRIKVEQEARVQRGISGR